MRSDCLTILHVSIWAVLVLTSHADGEDSKCETEMRVKRNTVHEAVVGQELRISCPVVFCSSSPPTVAWIKLEKTAASVPVTSDSHIETVWTMTTENEGTSSLVFKHIISSDSGQYQCHSGGSVSHSINVSVYGNVELTTETWTTVERADAEFTDQDSTQLRLFCVVGIMTLVFVAVVVYVTPKPECKGDNCV